MLKLLFVLIIFLLVSPKYTFQIDISRSANRNLNINRNSNIYKNYDLSILKREYESIISDISLNNFDYENDLSNILNQLNNLQFTNFTNFNSLEWFNNIINNNNNINNNSSNNIGYIIDSNSNSKSNSNNNNNNNEIYNNKIKVGIIVSSFEGMHSTSGIGTVYSIISEFLKQKGYDVTVIYTRDETPERKSFYEWKVELKKKGVTLIHLPKPSVRVDNPLFVRKSYQVYQYLKTQSFDILHFPDFEGMAYYCCLAKKNGLYFNSTSIIIGLHGPSVWVSKSNQNQKVSLQNDQLELEFMERKSIEMADIIWTPSNYIVSWLINEAGWTIPQSKLYLLPFLPPNQSPSTLTALKSNPIKEFVFFGRLEKRKGLSLFCDALDQLIDQHSEINLSNLKITFLGRSSTINMIDSIEYLKDRSFSWPFKVQFLTDKSSNEAINYLSNGLDKVAVIPSLEDNAPYTLYECLYMGIPFIASSQSSMIPLIHKDDQQTVLFNSKSSFSLMNKIVSIINNQDSTHSIVKPLFTKEKSEDTWSTFYKFINQQQQQQKEIQFINSNNNSSNSNNNNENQFPLVSICIVHYNRPYYLKQALESIENQDYLNYEVILVDDGSSNKDAIDYIKSLENKFKYNGWKIIKTSNRYLGAARNTASKEANGKYLLFLDDDNYLYENSISTYVQISRNTKANVVTAGHSIFNSSLSPISNQVIIDRQWTPLGPSLSVGLFKNCFGDANFFIEKSTFEAVGGFTEEYGVGLEDHEILAKLVIEGYKLSVSTEPLLYYRMHDQDNQMIFTTDSKSNQMRYIRPFSQVLSNGHLPVLKILATKEIHSNKLALNSQCNITLTSVTPTFGSPSGGTLITISGNGFNCGVSSVSIGQTSCLNPKIKTDSTLTCTTQESPTGHADIIVKGSDSSTSTLLDAFTFESRISVKSCNLGATADYLSCTLTKPSNQAETSCYKIFSTESLSLLGGGNSVKCEWTGPSILMVTYGTNPSVELNSQLEFLEGGITSVDGDNNAGQVVSVQAAEDVKPKVILKAPRIIDACDPLVLDATQTTGDNGKPLTYSWSVSGGGADSNQDLNKLLAQNVDKITIPNDILSEGEYIFTLEVKNWLGYSDKSSVTVSKQDGPVLYVNIEGSSEIITGATELSLIGNASLSGCSKSSTDTDSQTISYQWSVEPEITLKESEFKKKVFTVPANAWVFDTEYTIKLTATSGQVSNYATVKVKVTGRPVKAVIKGGDKKFSTGQTITLDASSSIDPTNNETSTDSFIYTWSCVVQKTKKPCNVNQFPSEAIIEISTSALGVGSYFISVDVAPKDDTSRSGSATSSIEVTNKPFLDVSIDKSLLPTYINPSEKLILRSNITGYTGNPSNLVYQWSMTEGTLEITPLSSAASTSLTGRNLVLKAGSLGPGCLYTFTITVTDKASDEKGSAYVTFTTETAPEGGTIICKQTHGGVTDRYSIEMSKDWVSNTDISGYLFRYRVGSSPEVSLGEKSSDNTIITFLPPGDVTIVGYVYSGNDIPAKSECTIKVDTPTDPEQVINFLTGVMTNSSIDIYQLSVGVKIANSLAPKPSSSKSSSKLMTQAEVVTQVNQFKSTGVNIVLNKINEEQSTLSAYGISSIVDLICTSTDLSTTVHPKSLSDSMKVMQKISPLMIQAPVLESDFSLSASFLANVNLQIKDQLETMNPDFASIAANVSSKILSVSHSLADGLLYRSVDGEAPISVSGNGLTISVFKSLPQDLNIKGQDIGGEKGQPKFSIPTDILNEYLNKQGGSNSGVSAKYVSIPSNTHFNHKTPKGSTLHSRTASLTLYSEKSAIPISGLKKEILIDMGKADSSGKEHKCAWWNDVKSQWSTDGCKTEMKSGSIICKCNHLTEFGVLEFAKSSTNIWVIIGPVIGGVVFAALLVGTVVIIKKKKSKDNKNKEKKTKEQLAKEKEDKRQQQREKKEQERKAKEDKKKSKEDSSSKDTEDKQNEKDSMEIPKTNKEKESFGDENDVEYILQEFKDIYIEAKKREQQKVLKNQPISPVSSSGSSLSTTTTPITSNIQQQIINQSTESIQQTTTVYTEVEDKAARTIQKAWKNYLMLNQIKKEAEVEQLLENIQELLSDDERDPFEVDQNE